MFYRRCSNYRPLNSARYNRIICQTVENTSFFERLSCIIARVGERLPRLQIQFRISRSFRPRNLVTLGSKIRFWIRRKEHTLSDYDTRSADILQDLGWDTLEQRRSTKLAISVFKYLNNLYPEERVETKLKGSFLQRTRCLEQCFCT